MPIQASARSIPFFRLPTMQGQSPYFARWPKITGKVPLYPAGFLGYMEYYCQANGDNHNSGTDQDAAARYTTVNGNWNGTTIYTPVDSSTPASFIKVGDVVSVYLDAAATAACIGRVSAIVAGVNGAITITAITGTVPTSSATGRSLKAGGAWLGPNAASGFPFTLANYGTTRDVVAHTVRTNMKNDATYSLTASVSFGTAFQHVVQGYTTSPGDGGKATWDGGVSTAQIIASIGGAGVVLSDHIFTTSFASGSLDLVTASHTSLWIRCVFKGARGRGFILGSVGGHVIECEAYDCNKSNTASLGGFYSSGGAIYIRCIAHDNTGANSAGFMTASGNVSFINCISESNDGPGYSTVSASLNGPTTFSGCDFYNNGGPAININSTNPNPFWIENCNFIRNAVGVSNASVATQGFIYNCGYGTGSMANAAGDTLNAFAKVSCLSYPLNTAPWVDPDNGDFRLTSALAISAGRGTFLQTATAYTGSVGSPDVGAVQHRDVGNAIINLSFLSSVGYIGQTFELLQVFTGDATVTIQSGSLPPGLSFSQPSTNSWRIAGIPTTLSTYDFVLRVVSGAGYIDYRMNILILPDPGEDAATGGVGGG